MAHNNEQAEQLALELNVNKSSSPRKRILIHCASHVDRDAVSRKTIDGVEHIIINSKTLPDDIVMNGILYPAEEIAASFQSLERTPAPIEHPQDSDGRFITATDPIALHNFYAGAYNENVRRENGRITIDKVVNVQEALKTDRGKRLLDRIEELKNSNDPRPIHTSVGVFIELEELEKPVIQTTGPSAGTEFESIAHNLVFDHDAILLGSVGAATPEDGVGMAVNQNGEEIELQNIELNQDLVTIPTKGIEELSFREIENKLFEALNVPPSSADFIVEVKASSVVFELGGQFFTVSYSVGNGTVTITGMPLRVKEDIRFLPATNNEKGDAMKELILNALTEAKVETEGLDDNALFAKYTELLANQSNSESDDKAGDDKVAIADVVANAVKPLMDRMDGLEAKNNEIASKETEELAELVGNSDKFPGLDVDTAKLLPVDKLRSLAANCGSSYGVPLGELNNNSKSDGDMSFDMPE